MLCDSCVEPLVASGELASHQIQNSTTNPTADALIDPWGRAHLVGRRTMIGRAPQAAGLTIADASVSRHHAHLTRETTEWRIRDLGSSNGTFVNDEPVTEPVGLKHGDRIVIGTIGLYLVRSLGPVPENESDTTHPRITIPPSRAQTQPSAVVAARPTNDTLPALAMRVEQATGGGGLLELANLAIHLTPNQTELLQLLANRMLAEPHQSPQLRGFVRSSELLETITWATAHPDENHLKQLVRRTRRQLVADGVGDLIESRHRFGYRLRVIPAPLNLQ